MKEMMEFQDLYQKKVDSLITNIKFEYFCCLNCDNKLFFFFFFFFIIVLVTFSFFFLILGLKINKINF